MGKPRLHGILLKDALMFRMNGMPRAREATLRQGSRGRAVPSFRTRREPIHGGSVATSLSLTVLNEGTAHPLLCAKLQAIGF